MYCSSCGTQNDDKALKCSNCGRPLHEPVAPPPGAPPVSVPNYLAQAILCTIFCCLPAGIAGIVYAAQVNSKLGAGDIAGAQAASRNAKIWCWASFGVGLAALIAGVLLGVLGEIFQGNFPS